MCVNNAIWERESGFILFLLSLSVSPPPVLLEVLQDLMESSQANAGTGSPASSAALRVARLDESGGAVGGDDGASASSVAALQIPVQIPLQITHLGGSASHAPKRQKATLATTRCECG